MRLNTNIIELNLKEEYSILVEELNERGRRKWAGFQAQRLGHGGKTIVHRATGLDYKTINRGINDIEKGDNLDKGRIRRPGGGRQSLSQKHPNLKKDLENLVEPTTRGDPQSPLRWTCKSTNNLSEALGEKGSNKTRQNQTDFLRFMGCNLQVLGDKSPQIKKYLEKISRGLVTKPLLGR